MKQNVWWIIPGCVALLLLILPSQSVRSDGETVESLLQRILEGQRQMQADIQEIKKRLDEKDREIAELKSLFSNSIEIEKTQAEKDQTLSAPPGSRQTAEDQYQRARALEHNAIFKVRKGEQMPWFKRVAAEYHRVVETNPQSPEAPKAQLRIARIQWRYLDDLLQAKIEFQKTIADYPGTPEAEEAQRILDKLP